MSKELSKDEFIAHLISVGWSKEDAEKEWENIQNEDESGYDGT